MADPPSSPTTAITIESNSNKPESVNPNILPNPTTDSSAAQAPSQQQSATPPASNTNPNPSLNPNPTLVSPPVHAFPSYAPPPQIAGASVPSGAQSFRPVPQFSTLPNYQNPSVGVQPPGVSAQPVIASGAPGAVAAPPPMMPYQIPPAQPPNPALRHYAPMPNGFAAIPGAAPQGTMPLPGIQRYPSPYPAMVRPIFPPCPPGTVGMLPPAARPLVPGIPGVRPLIPTIIRPPVPSVTPAEKPQTTVYVGKISPSVENDFMLSLLRFCGPVKSWKRAQDPTDGTPRGFGFCEFESAEGVLRALRLLSKFNIDGQELVLNVNQATREYLERYVEKKTENSKNLKESQAMGVDKEDGTAVGVEKNETPKSSVEDSSNASDKGNKENTDPANFGIVTDEDKEGDKEALEKLSSMIEERLKTRPLPPPPPPPQIPADGPGNANSEMPTKSREDSDVDIRRHDSAEDKNDDETTSDNKAASEQDRPGTSSPDRSRKYDRRSRERDRDRDLKREKEREVERYERESERERIRKEREHRRMIEEAERDYEERLKDWEHREREKEKQRHYEKEKDKERERKRRKEILYDEEDDDDDSRKRWRRNVLEDKRRKRLLEKKEDEADRREEEKEIAEAKKKEEEEKRQQQQRDESKLLSDHVMNGSDKKVLAEEVNDESKDKAFGGENEGDSGNENDDGVLQNGTVDESTMASLAESDVRQSGNAPARKLGFGLVGSGKRAAVPSVFHEEDDDDAHKEKKMRPLVPIDYSTEELQAVQPTVSAAQPPNLAAAAEFVKRISNVTSKEEKPDVERERSKRSHDRSSQRDRDRNDEDINRIRDDKDRILERDRNWEHGQEKVKTPDKQKLLDAKQLIDMIPKTKDELFSYEINWAVYDKHELHERMRPWISKKITEFLGEEETTLVDYIVSSTQEHVKASQMLEMLQSILDDEAEMFVLKMWRMLIFEIKKVETGLALRSKS
ncbi:RNA-binding protein 25 isoform X2 [Jatropha curcas]|uniref:RNA-binding protein 25 isoform X2 n=1 Tax=Jatropha curcas TaxID=180498 RepID=UPI0005FB97A4|nr:RNA-binding protein 25 isoform X2 [Jatropha curcas]